MYEKEEQVQEEEEQVQEQEEQVQEQEEQVQEQEEQVQEQEEEEQVQEQEEEEQVQQEEEQVQQEEEEEQVQQQEEEQVQQQEEEQVQQEEEEQVQEEEDELMYEKEEQVQQEENNVIEFTDDDDNNQYIAPPTNTNGVFDNLTNLHTADRVHILLIRPDSSKVMHFEHASEKKCIYSLEVHKLSSAFMNDQKNTIENYKRMLYQYKKEQDDIIQVVNNQELKEYLLERYKEIFKNDHCYNKVLKTLGFYIEDSLVNLHDMKPDVIAKELLSNLN